MVVGSLRVSIEAAPRVRVGDPIKVVWTRSDTARPGGPLYLVLTAPADVRFAGTGFMALSADAKAPQNFAYGGKTARALVSFHRPSDTAKSGDISVLPYRRGAQTIGWSLVTAGPCGEQMLARAEKAIEVAPGSPEIVVQDRFATSAPLSRIASPVGTHEVLVFKDRYEVFEIATGSRIFSRAGTEPNFSPTGRFVTANRKAVEKIEITDLVSGLVTAETPSMGTLGWARGDSYAVYASEDGGSIYIWNTMADGKPLVAESRGFTCMACGTLEETKVRFDLDRGFVALQGQSDVKVADLVTRVLEPRTDAEYNRLIDAGKFDEAAAYQRKIAAFESMNAPGGIAFIRRAYDASFAFPRGWEFGDKLLVTHVSTDPEYLKVVRRMTGMTVVRPKIAAAGRVAVATPKGKDLRGRPRSGRSSNMSALPLATGNSPAVLFTRLAAAGIPTANPPAVPDRIPIDVTQQIKDSGEGLARQIRTIVPAADKLFSKGFQCFFENAPADAVLVDPEYISEIWRWRDGGSERLLLQTLCPQGAAGRYAMGDLFVLQSSGVSKLTDLLGEDAIYGPSGNDLQLRIVRVAERAFAIVLGARFKIAVIDPISGKRIGADVPLTDGALLSDLRMTSDGKHLVQLYSDGRFFVHRIADGKRMLIGAHVDDEIVVANDDGLYDTTYEGAQSVQVRFPGSSGLYRFNQFESSLRRTKLAAAVLGGATLLPPASVPAPPTAELTISATATNGRRFGKVIVSSERELAAVRLYVDGRLNTEIPVKGRRAEVPIDLPDPGGGRWITAIVVDTQGLVSQPNAVQLPGSLRPLGTLRAVAIGVDSYQDPSLPRLAYAKADAQRLLRALKASERKAVRTVQTTSLLDAQVTPERLLASVREAAQATGPDDMLVVFYAGHGLDDVADNRTDASLVLTTAVTRMDDLKSTAVSWASLAQALGVAKGKIVVILDSCHSGIAGSDAFATNDDAVSVLMTRAGAPMVVLAGSKGRQFSEENAKAGGGVFTAAIAAAISEERATHDLDRSGLIDLGELYTAVKARVFEMTSGQQTPWLTRNALVGEMALF